MNNVQEEILSLLQKLEADLKLAEDSLLKSERYYATKYSIEDRLKELSSNFDERTQLSIEKAIPKWRNVPKSGIFLDTRQTLDSLQLHALLIEILSAFSEEAKEIKSENVIEAGKPHEGRVILRNIFSLANNEMLLVDSYFRPVILEVLSEYLLDNPDLKVRILVGDNNRLNAFKASYEAFILQYPNKIEVRKIADHPRYILIDDEVLFNPDPSFHDWGVKTVNIHQMIDLAEITKVKGKLREDWNVGVNI